MADEKRYVTSLVVEADDSQVARLRDTLQQVSTLMQAVQARGPIGGAGGGGGWGGGAGAGGAGGSGGGGGWSGGGAPSGGSGWGGGSPAWGGGSGGAPPSPGSPPPGPQSDAYKAFLKGWGTAGRGATLIGHPDEGLLVTAAQTAGDLIGLGPAAGAIMGAMIQRGHMAQEYDAAAARSRGLLGRSAGLGAGAGMGFSAAETEGVLQQLGGSGVDAGRLMSSADAVGTVFSRAMEAERAGIGAGAVGGIASLFREGGGAGGGTGADIVQVLGMAMGSAVKAGLENADVPKYLARISSASSAMADKGVDMSPASLVQMAEQFATLMNGSGAAKGQRRMEWAAGLVGLGQNVAGGGGSPLQQFALYEAAGLGRDGIGIEQAKINLEAGRLPYLAEVMARFRNIPREGRAMALQSAGLATSMTTAASMADNLGAGRSFDGFDWSDLAGYGLGELASRGSRGVSGFMAKIAGMEVGDIRTGLGFLPTMLNVRGISKDAYNKFVGPGVTKALGLMGRGIQALQDGIHPLDWLTGTPGSAGPNFTPGTPGVTPVGTPGTGGAVVPGLGGAPPAVLPPMPGAPTPGGVPADSTVPGAPVKGAMLHLAPGLERWFEISFGSGHDLALPG